MIYVDLDNYSGQVLAGMDVEAPRGAVVYNEKNEPIIIKEPTHFHVSHNNRLGINRYKLNLVAPDGSTYWVMNYQIGKKKKKSVVWSLKSQPLTDDDLLRIYNIKAIGHKRIKKNGRSRRMGEI
jgi:hypothetical protein